MQEQELCIDITPESLKTPEGRARVRAAIERFSSATAEVANLADSLVKEWATELAIAMHAHDRAGDFGGDLDDVLRAVQNREEVQEELLLAIAGK